MASSILHSSSSRFNGHSAFGSMSKFTNDDSTYTKLQISDEEISDSDNADNDSDYVPAAGTGRVKHRVFPSKYAPDAVFDWFAIALEKKVARKKRVKEDALGHLLTMGWEVYYIPKKNREELRYKSPYGKVYISLRKACEAYCIDLGVAAVVSDHPQAVKEYSNPTVAAVGKETPSAFKKPKGGESERAKSPPVQNWPGKEKKPPGTVVKGNSRRSVRRTALSDLIDQGLVSPGNRVYYSVTAKADPLMAWGSITNEGVIKCDCCSEVFSISHFEAHTGSTKRRPAANIFLEDGRSLLDCQKQLDQNQYQYQNQKQKQTRPIAQKVNNNDNARCSDTPCLDKNDCICSLCHYGGNLILCDLCPAAFHGSCLGFKGVPIGDWFCSSCSCKICGQASYDFFNGVSSSSSDSDINSSFVKCVQCEQNVHIGCVKSVQVLEDYDEDSNQTIDRENWFCTKRCKDVHMGLQSLLWKPIPVGLAKDNLTFTLMKHSPNHTIPESYRKKFNSSLAVLHQSFRPVKDPITKKNIIEDVLFSRRSESKRLNFEGFYTAILERKNTITTVATVRVYGDEVAEIPFVATRMKYRRHGLCRSLMNQLEHQLMKLEVKRVTLPSVPEALDTWSSGFGFKEMTDSDRLELVKFTFLGFQHTVRCQKELLKRSRIPKNLEWGPRKRLKKTVNLEDKIISDSSMCLDDWSSFSDAFD